MRFRIISKDGKSTATDADTGAVLDWIKSIDFVVDSCYGPTLYLGTHNFDAVITAPDIPTAPIVATPAAASPGAVTGTTTDLSVLGASSSGAESPLTYTWAATSVPSGAASPTFSVND